ncbi:ATP-binding protein [Streptomyces griseoflavus]|uniref:ATP-binding protein n=1 Tax=Streptomyces griseoflavus TaxID=35619 RepID=UPI003F4CEA3C
MNPRTSRTLDSHVRATTLRPRSARHYLRSPVPQGTGEPAGRRDAHGRPCAWSVVLPRRSADDLPAARGERLPDRQPPSPDAESGRGLLLVDALADRWGVPEDRFPRKTVRAELRLGQPEPGK